MTSSFAQNLSLSPGVETLERIRLTARMSRHEWLDLLGLQFSDYQKFKSGKLALTDKTLTNVARQFDLPVDDLEMGRIDFADLSMRLDQSDAALPEKYSKAAYSRKRSLLSAMEFIEKTYGWRLRLDILQKFGIPERQLQNAFEPISMRFITDLCFYLRRRSFTATDFFSMGSYTFDGNRNTVVAKLFSEQRSAAEAFELLFGEALKLYEQNCDYKILSLDRAGATVQMSSNPHVAAEMGLRHVGNEHTCHFKAGIIASTPKYLGLSSATVTHPSCVHRGDGACIYEIQYGEPLPFAN